MCRETFGVTSRVPSTVLHFNMDLGLLLIRCRGQGPHFGMTGESRGFSQGAAGFSSYDGAALEKEMATHSSVLAWRIPGIAEPGGLPSVGSHRVGHD